MSWKVNISGSRILWTHGPRIVYKLVVHNVYTYWFSSLRIGSDKNLSYQGRHGGPKVKESERLLKIHGI